MRDRTVPRDARYRFGAPTAIKIRITSSSGALVMRWTDRGRWVIRLLPNMAVLLQKPPV